MLNVPTMLWTYEKTKEGMLKSLTSVMTLDFKTSTATRTMESLSHILDFRKQ